MSDDKPRRSRTAWPGPMSVAGVEPGHTHELPRELRFRYRLLLAAVVALLLALGTLTYFVYQQQQYIEGRGELRDLENERLQQQIVDAVCDLLDQLPEGGLLERPRAKYGCGPGIPIEELPAELRERYEGRTPAPAPTPTPTPAPAPTTEAPMGAPAVPNPPQPTPFYPPPGSGDGPVNAPGYTPPTTTTAPATGGVDMGPVADTVCELINVCLEEP